MSVDKALIPNTCLLGRERRGQAGFSYLCFP
jgi:hypothetical protein